MAATRSSPSSLFPARLAPAWRAALWMAVPALAYFLLLRHFWFDAPFWDDYETLLGETMQLQDAATLSRTLEILFQQHNEHRIALTRLLAWTMAAFPGGVDFRVVMLAGNLAWAGLLVLFWKEFRGEVAAPLFAAAAFLLLQLTYWQSALFAMAAASNMPALFFGFACLACAMRGGPRGLPWTIVFGVLAACSQANGVLALPIAAAGLLLQRRRRDAVIVALAAVVVGLAYFHGYTRPPQHPSPTVALDRPFATLQFFLIIVGGVIPRAKTAMVLGIALLAAIAWLIRRGEARRYPAAAAWIAYVLASAAAAAVGRVGLGVSYESRYAIYSSAVLAIVALLLFARRAWSRAATTWVVVAAAVFSIAMTRMAWPNAREHSFKGHLLARAAPADSTVDADDYFGVIYYLPDQAPQMLREAGRRGIYEPRRQVIHPTRIEVVPAIAPGARRVGHVESVVVSGKRVAIDGWTDVVPTSPGRALVLVSPDATPERMSVRATSRADVAETLDNAELLFGGFHMEAEFGSEAQAASAARRLCVAAHSPRAPQAEVMRDNVPCPVSG